MKSVLFWKITTLLGLMVVMLIPIAQLMSVIDERSGYRQSVVGQVSESTSGAQRVLGPLIVIPYVEREEKKDERTNGSAAGAALPLFAAGVASGAGAPKVEVRKLGIYQTQVYQGPLNFKVRFGQPELADLQRANVTLGQPFLLVALSDSRGIKSISPLEIPQPVAFEPGTGVGSLRQDPRTVDAGGAATKEGLNADFTLTLAGTSSLSLVPLGRSSELQLQSNWPHPNFLGNFLPDERRVTEQGFSARWRSTWFANNINSAFHYDDGIIDEDKLPAFSASLVEPVDHYQLAERAVKYALLFIGLTFMAFFLFETLTGLRVHPIQYLLVGAALVLFYLILLAFSEHLGFALAYLAASIACSGLIGFYLSAVLRGKLRGALFAASLLLLYGVLYLLLQSEDNALVLGAGLLFAILAGIMLLTRKLDWYQVADPARLAKETPAGEDEPRFRLWK